MVIKKIGIVSVPKRPRSLGSVLSWCRAVTKTLQQLRDQSVSVRRGSTVTSRESSSVCRFGEIITYQEDSATVTGIRGGIIHCGDQNFEVPNQALNLSDPGDRLVYIRVPTESNRDDDSEIFLPGIKSGTAPAATWGRETWSSSATYPANDLPAVATGLGDIILPIGRLKIADGAATLTPAGCGNFRIGQCAGILSYSRE